MPRCHPAVGLLLVAAAPAQSPVLKDVNRLFPAFRHHSPVHAVGDVDGDGHRDVVFVAYGSYSEVWLGSADGVFRRRPDAFPRIDEAPTAVALADVDGDGDLDCACATNPSGSFPQPGAHGEDRVFVNDGTGRFAPSPHGPLPLSGASTDVVAGDLDGDGDVDLVVGRPAGSPFFTTNVALLNDGAGRFAPGGSGLPATLGTNALALFDADGDGDLDLYCGNSSSSWPAISDQLLRNDGLGAFSAMPLATIPGNSTVDVQVRDFDGDGDVDLITLETLPLSGHAIQYRRNDGAGTFTSFVPALPAVPGPISQLLLGDWNGDGLTDFAVRHGAALHTLVQTTPGTFTPSALPLLWTMERNVLAFDLDGDGASDLIAPSANTYGPYSSPSGSPESQWFRRLGTSWAPMPQPLLPALPFGSGCRAKLADVDRDGDLDVVQSPHSGPGAIWLRQLDGSFAPMPAAALGAFATPLLPTASGDVACADVDGDGDVDIVCAVREQPYATPPLSQLYRNTPSGFVATPLPLRADQAALADLDGDGDVDMVLTGFDTRAVLHNDGSGTFTVTTLPPIAVQLSVPLHVTDFDGDGDLDLGVYHSSWPLPQSGYLANDGTGQFTPVPVPTLSASPRVLAADFDHDGDVDLLADGGSSLPRQLLHNTGNGTFTVSLLPVVAGAARVALAADVDGDGWTDLVEIDGCGPPCGQAAARIVRNDQAGGFTPLPGSIVETPYDVRETGVGDVDGDGDLDLMLASWHGIELYRNLHHQIAWQALPRVGRTLTLELYGRANEGCLLGLAFAPAALPLPGFGTLRLDPGSLLVAAIGTYDAAGTGVFVAAVPDDPSLLGLTLYWQALSIGATLHLGNLETTTFAER